MEAVVRAVSLMPVRGIILLTEVPQFGFTERLYVHLHLPKIIKLQNAGLSAHEIAAAMNALIGFTFGGAWDAGQVMGVLKRNEQIQRTDTIVRAHRALIGKHCNEKTENIVALTLIGRSIILILRA
jgi:hypothetical protein